MPKVVYNTQYGGFGLSPAAIGWMAERGHPEAIKASPQNIHRSHWYLYDTDRDDDLLVACVEALGAAANGEGSHLKIATIPPGHNWDIEEHDGLETIRHSPRNVRSGK